MINLTFFRSKIHQFYIKMTKIMKAKNNYVSKMSVIYFFSKLLQNKQRKYGYYQCSECDNKWRSAYTWLIPGKGLLKQMCKNCNKNQKARHIVSQQTSSKRNNRISNTIYGEFQLAVPFAWILRRFLLTMCYVLKYVVFG